MTSQGQSHFWLVVFLGAGPLFCGNLPAQAPPNPSELARTNPTVLTVPLPPIPTVRSPVELFRELLAMDVEERTKALAQRTPEGRKRLLAKLREYQSLRPEERELRLRATELSWFLQPLMRLPPTNRVGLIEQVPPELRILVQSRLMEWDLLPPPLQTEILTNEVAIRYFAGSEASLRSLTNMTAQRKAKLEEGIVQWRAIPEDQREQIIERFNHFFELRPADKRRALNTLSDAERKQMEKTLRNYANLTPQQRDQCLRSFEKFADMSLPERQQFLKNADRWKILSPSERQAWRDLVHQMPYMPLDAGLPRVHSPPRAETVSATNTH